jgi:hypothetical protein
MRMFLPTLRDRQSVDRALRAFFLTHRPIEFRRAIATICRFYDLRLPTVEWYEYLDWGRGAGRTWENGKIGLVHPENWKKGRKYNGMKQWVLTVYHEMAHYLFWTDAERKADLFAVSMMQGVGHDEPSRDGRQPARVRLTGARSSVGRRRSAGLRATADPRRATGVGRASRPGPRRRRRRSPCR